MSFLRNEFSKTFQELFSMTLFTEMTHLQSGEKHFLQGVKCSLDKNLKGVHEFFPTVWRLKFLNFRIFDQKISFLIIRFCISGSVLIFKLFKLSVGPKIANFELLKILILFLLDFAKENVKSGLEEIDLSLSESDLIGTWGLKHHLAEKCFCGLDYFFNHRILPLSRKLTNLLLKNGRKLIILFDNFKAASFLRPSCGFQGFLKRRGRLSPRF